MLAEQLVEQRLVPRQDISFTSNSYNVSELFKTPLDSIIEPQELALKL